LPSVNKLYSELQGKGLEVLLISFREDPELAGAKGRVDGVLTTAESIFGAQRQRVVQLAAQHRLPGMYPYRGMVAAGGLMAYDSYTSALQARTATYVDRILKGAKPSDLPVEQPTKIELVINRASRES